MIDITVRDGQQVVDLESICINDTVLVDDKFYMFMRIANAYGWISIADGKVWGGFTNTREAALEVAASMLKRGGQLLRASEYRLEYVQKSLNA